MVGPQYIVVPPIDVKIPTYHSVAFFVISRKGGCNFLFFLLNFGQLNDSRAADRFSSTNAGQRDVLKEIGGVSLWDRFISCPPRTVCVCGIYTKVNLAFACHIMKGGNYMSTSKRFVSLLLALVLMVGILAVPAMAAETPASARACNHPTTIVSSSYTAWRVLGTAPCQHGCTGQLDRNESRVATLHYRCTQCGVEHKTTNVTEYRTYCIGQGAVVSSYEVSM